METSPNEPKKLASFLIAGKLKDANSPSTEKVVLRDECGDSLWDDVLEQEDKHSQAEATSENKVADDNEGTEPKNGFDD